MRATAYISEDSDRTYLVALAIVVLLGAAEILALTIHYAGQARAARRSAPPAPAVAEKAAPQVTPAAITPAAPAPTASTEATAAPSAPSHTALSAAEQLLKEASSLRERGDTTNALARLHDAAQREPLNANVLAEMARIYESIQALDRSNETWRKIQEIGPAAGALYELAELKLKVGVAPASPAAAAGPGFAGVSPLDSGKRAGLEGIPDGSTFGISEASVTETPDAEAETNLTLRVGVKVRSSTLVDHTKVKIQVYFYDTVDNNKVALTDAEVNYEWLTPNHDWKSANPEMLAVSYVRLKNGAVSSEAALTEAAAAVTPPTVGKKSRSAPKSSNTSDGNRKYAGYQVRVYYNEQLQDVRAEPTKLLNLFPPPNSLSSQ